MKHFPNSQEQQVTLSNWRTAPFNSWAFHHVGEIVPSATILNDPIAIQNFRTEEMDFRNISIKGPGDQYIDHRQFIETTHTDALVILKSGVIIEEKYFSGMTPSSQHILMLSLIHI